METAATVFITSVSVPDERQGSHLMEMTAANPPERTAMEEAHDVEVLRAYGADLKANVTHYVTGEGAWRGMELTIDTDPTGIERPSLVFGDCEYGPMFQLQLGRCRGEFDFNTYGRGSSGACSHTRAGLRWSEAREAFEEELADWAYRISA